MHTVVAMAGGEGVGAAGGQGHCPTTGGVGRGDGGDQCRLVAGDRGLRGQGEQQGGASGENSAGGKGENCAIVSHEDFLWNFDRWWLSSFSNVPQERSPAINELTQTDSTLFHVK